MWNHEHILTFKLMYRFRGYHCGLRPHVRACTTCTVMLGYIYPVRSRKIIFLLSIFILRSRDTCKALTFEHSNIILFDYLCIFMLRSMHCTSRRSSLEVTYSKRFNIAVTSTKMKESYEVMYLRIL